MRRALFFTLGTATVFGVFLAVEAFFAPSSAAQDDFSTVAPGEFELAPPDDEAFEIAPEEKTAESRAVGTLPPGVVAPTVPIEAKTVVDDAEAERLKKDPFFREFSAAFEESSPLPAIPELAFPLGDENVETDVANGEFDPLIDADVAKEAREPGVAPLDEDLSIPAVDWDSLKISPKDRAALERFDAEITRLTSRWRDAELNRKVVGRREIVWVRDGDGRFETNEPTPIATSSDWDLSLDGPFFFEVVDSANGTVFYTKAGDFELVDGVPALVREISSGLATGGGGEGAPRTLVLSIEPRPGVPSGRAERSRILVDGKIQGVDASGTRVVDANLGKIPLFLFDNPARLSSDDGVFFLPTSRSGEPRRVELPPNSPIGVRSGKLTLSNGRPEEILARIVVLTKSKKRLLEILTQPRSARSIAVE